MNVRGPQRSAFTLIELLVVVAIIALLISILLPSLSAAREAARAVVCGTTLRTFGTGLGNYATEYRDGIPGTCTSGLKFMAEMPPGIGDFYKSKMPVQAHDWMTPILSLGMEMPAKRSEKFKFLLEKFRCASQSYTATVYGSGIPGGNEKQEFINMGAVPATSYLMPMFFQWLGQADAVGRVLGYYDRSSPVPIYARQRLHYPPENFEVKVDHYTPRIDKVGSAARKIFAADGTRYTNAGGLLDYDITPLPDWFGSFASAGGWWSGDASYGPPGGSQNWSGMPVTPGRDSGGQNIGVSYRHGVRGTPADVRNNKGTINAVFFDGHVERMTDRQTREIHFWYPKGGVVQLSDQGMTYVPPGPPAFVIP